MNTYPPVQVHCNVCQFSITLHGSAEVKVCFEHNKVCGGFFVRMNQPPYEERRGK